MQTDNQHPLFRPGRNCREIVTASHAAIAVDCANYYHALYEAIVKARHSIFVVGWDIDSRIKLLRGDHAKGATHPIRFFELIQWKAQQNPKVQIYLNRWDFSLFMARDRELLGKYRWYRQSPPNVHYWQDSTVPTGACHHQKIVTVDDEIAFCGGMDVALRRWDERRHMPRDHNRIDPTGEGEAVTFAPYHDIQMLVAGDAARALAVLARERWEYATGGIPVALRPQKAIDDGHLPASWPESLKPSLYAVPVAIALTKPEWDKEQGEYHVERLYLDMIACAETFIYMENQFFCRLNIAGAINKRLREKPELEVLLVSSYDPNGIMERKAIWHGRVHFRDIVESGGMQDRVVMAYPVSHTDGMEKPVRIHSKLMVVDDRYLRVGSSNINNRSMRLDTECDLVFEAKDNAMRQAVAAIRNDLIREHTGHEIADIERVVRHGGVGTLLHYLTHSRQHLYKLDDERYRYERFTEAAKRVADSERPLLPIGVSMVFAKMKFFRLFLVVLAVAALALVWKVTPLAHYASPETVIPLLEQVRHTPWAVPAAMLVYTVGTLAFFPHMAMTGVIVIVFSPVQAFSIAMTGSLVSGAIGFWLGRTMGLKSMRALVGETAEKISLYAKKGGIIGITLLRLLPIAPYTAVNLALGMLEIPFVIFMVGTFLGTLPGTTIAAYLGYSMLELWQNPSMENLGVILAGLLCWVAVIGGSHYAARRWRKHRSKPA